MSIKVFFVSMRATNNNNSQHLWRTYLAGTIQNIQRVFSHLDRILELKENKMNLNELKLKV